MNRVFIYATLKRRNVLEEALGENHGKLLIPATAFGYRESTMHYNHESWPTLWALGPTAKVPGDIINVSDSELEKLRQWEKNYRLRIVATTEGEAWAFIFDPVQRVPLGSVMRMRGK